MSRTSVRPRLVAAGSRPRSRRLISLFAVVTVVLSMATIRLALPGAAAAAAAIPFDAVLQHPGQRGHRVARQQPDDLPGFRGAAPAPSRRWRPPTPSRTSTTTSSPWASSTPTPIRRLRIPRARTSAFRPARRCCRRCLVWGGVGAADSVTLRGPLRSSSGHRALLATASSPAGWRSEADRTVPMSTPTRASST